MLLKKHSQTLVLLHRFSKDVDTVDADLRMFIQNWMSTVAPVIATIIIICYSTPIFVAVLVPLGILFVILQVGLRCFYCHQGSIGGDVKI